MESLEYSLVKVIKKNKKLIVTSFKSKIKTYLIGSCMGNIQFAKCKRYSIVLLKYSESDLYSIILYYFINIYLLNLQVFTKVIFC